MRDRAKLIAVNLDYSLIVFLVLILCSGFMVLRSASVSASERFAVNYLHQQAAASLIGFCMMLGLQVIDLSSIKGLEKPVYIVMILFLASTLVFGETAKGAQRYLDIGPITLQPAEPVKILFIYSYAKYLASKNTQLKTWRKLIPALCCGALPLMLVMALPDLGTGMVFAALIFGMLLAAGASLMKLALLFGGSIGGVVFWIYGHMTRGWWLPLKDYQLMRLVVFVDPGYDPRNWGWNLLQAQITVGSGGIWGQGWGQGVQTASGYLPEQWTDFIFCVLGEEFGFIGCFVVLALYFSLLTRCLMIASRSRDLFGFIAISGVVSMFLFHVLQNVGMVVGVMPITGIPLPFVSYGRSALISGMIAIGIALNIGVYKDYSPF